MLQQVELLQNIWWEEGKSLNISIPGLYGPWKTYNDISSNDLHQIIRNILNTWVQHFWWTEAMRHISSKISNEEYDWGSWPCELWYMVKTQHRHEGSHCTCLELWWVTYYLREMQKSNFEIGLKNSNWELLSNFFCGA